MFTFNGLEFYIISKFVDYYEKIYITDLSGQTSLSIEY
jgi:hypothetical protein